MQNQPVEESLSQARLSESGLSRSLLLIGLFCSLILLSGLLTGCGANKKQTRASETVTVDGVRLLFPSTLPDELYTRSTGTGATREVAVKNALLSAVQQTMGVLIVSETTVANDRLLRDIYAGYSSGIVKSFKIVGCAKGYYRVSCTVNAITKPWAIRDNIFATGRAVSVDGQSLYGQYVTHREVLLQRRKLMDYYLSRIRTVGLVPTIKSVSVVPSASEEALIRIQFSVGWNPAFRQELLDFLKRLEQDTGGDRIRRRVRDYRSMIFQDGVFDPSYENFIISWGQRGGMWFAEEAVIISPDKGLNEIVMDYTYGNIAFSIEPFQLCDEIDPDTSILHYAGYGPKNYHVTIWVQPQFLANIDNIEINMGCPYKS